MAKSKVEKVEQKLMLDGFLSGFSGWEELGFSEPHSQFTIRKSFTVWWQIVEKKSMSTRLIESEWIIQLKKFLTREVK